MSENQKKSILIVDDYQENRTAIIRMLDDLDIDIIETDSGKEAIQRMKERRPAVVLLDAEMPEMDGYQVINQMFSEEATRHIPVLLMTSNLSDRKQSLHRPLLDITDFMTRPLNKEMLVAKVKIFLELDSYRDAIKNLHGENEKLLEAMHEGVLGVDVDGRIKFANSSAIRMLRASATQLMDTYVESIFEEPIQKVEPSWEEHPIRRVCLDGNILQVEKSEFWRADGSSMKVKFAAVPVNDLDGMHIVLAFKQLTKERDSKLKLSQLSSMDPLTGLPSRTRFDDAVNDAVRRAERSKGYLAVLFLDLDHFKNINESLGHDIGDQLIKGVAERLKLCVRRNDTIARIGGDEFAILLEGIDTPQGASVAAQNLLDQFQQPFLLEGHEIFTGASIGIATYPNGGDGARSLLKNADSAAYRAKSLGRNNFQYYNADLNKLIIDRLELENDLHHVLKRSELVLDYVPVVNVHSKHVNAFEVRVRWDHPRRGMLDAEQFIPVAEDAGLIIPISEWIIETACQQVRHVMEEGGAQHDFLICFNISTNHIIHEDFAAWMYQTLQNHGLSGDNILIELTESVMMSRQQSCLEVLADLDSMNVRLALSDFGTGFAPYNLLRTLPLDVIKMNASFATEVMEETAEKTIMRHTVAMAHDLGLEVWVEGVEGVGQLQVLADMGVDWVQGAMFSESISPACFIDALQQVDATNGISGVSG